MEATDFLPRPRIVFPRIQIHIGRLLKNFIENRNETAATWKVAWFRWSERYDVEIGIAIDAQNVHRRHGRRYTRIRELRKHLTPVQRELRNPKLPKRRHGNDTPR